ncbi:MAG: cation transporter [Dehalococcoidia bacterium]|nr:cation transporter [Dehalococcoidia bacterium]
MFHTKTGAAGLSIGTVALLSLLKLAVGIISGSVSIIAQAIDSLLDLFASLVTFFSLRFAAKPADREHPFGHGKAESISGVVQAGLIFAAAAYILYQAVTRIVVGADIEYVTAGIVVMAVCIVVNIIVSRHLLRVARETDSAALEANARNLAADVYTALGVLAGLVAVRITGLNILDPIIAIGVALLILKTAYGVMRKSFPHLIDVRLPEDEEALIESTMREHMGELVGFHSLRTRKAGSERHIELHIIMARDASVERAHKLCDHLEEEIKSKLPNAYVMIHVEPCDRECDSCPDNCPQDQRTPGP